MFRLKGVVLGAAVCIGCGVSGVDVQVTGNGGSSGSGEIPSNGGDGETPSGGDGPVNTNGGSPGSAGSGVNGGAAGEGPAPCETGDRQCDGNTPQVCKKGVWQDEPECGGTKKVCIGEGICAPYRLLNAGIDSFGLRPAEPIPGAAFVLKEQTLSAAPRVCATTGKKFCITGGIR